MILGINPLSILTVLLCAATIFWCFYLIRRIYNRRIRILAMLLSFLGVFQLMKLAHRYGLLELNINRPIEQFADLFMLLIALGSIGILQLHNTEQRSQSMRLRLAEAGQNESTPENDPNARPRPRLPLPA